MEETAAVLTVFFEEQTRFWVGVYERREDGSLAAAKVIFGAEPKTQEIHTFLLANWNRLRFGKTAEPVCFRQRKNPKRMQREARRQTGEQGVGTKAQQALVALREEQKTERKSRTKAEKAEEAERRFLQRQEKRREKRKGH